MLNNNSLDEIRSQKKIKVMGIGGSGCNTISRLSALNFEGIELITANTDSYSLSTSTADKIIFLGENMTSGHGAGGDIQIGKSAAEESFKTIIDCIQGADLLFLTAGLGGGTGSGAIEIVARIAASLGILTISNVTLPFSFEAERRKNSAYEATIGLQAFTNTLITIPNDRLVDFSEPDTPIKTTLGMSDDVLIKQIDGISEILNSEGLLTIDFSHISKFMNLNGGTFISTGFGNGENRVISAIKDALSHPLLEPIPIHQAQGMVVKLTGDIKIDEIDTVTTYLKEKTNNDVEILPVVEHKEFANDQIKIALILTGMGATPIEYPQKNAGVPIHSQSDKNHLAKAEKKEPKFIPSIQDYGDELEIPAFLRRGYNLEQQYS
jgi:cell division protein FtsZ